MAFKKMQAEMNSWLMRQGAEVLSPTNPFELVRFRAQGGTHVIYERKNGVLTANGFAEECLQAFRAGKRLGMGITTGSRSSTIRMKSALLQRDGDLCFFCAKPMPQDDMTVEHLVSFHKGGPNHMDNFALAHEECNKQADNIPLVEKIKVYAKARAGEVIRA